MEQKWLKTLAALKSDDPRLYDNSTKFFDSEGILYTHDLQPFIFCTSKHNYAIFIRIIVILAFMI